MTTIQLVSYGPAQSVELHWEQVAKLRKAAGNQLSVSAGDIPGTWTFKAGPDVGTVSAGGCRVLIRPNIPPTNLFHLLEPDGDALDVQPAAFEYERSSDLLAAFATFFCRVIERATSRGLDRAYREFQDRLTAPRGRIDIAAHSRAVGIVTPLVCRFDEYTADVPLNRILRAAAERLLHVPYVAPATRQALARIPVLFEEASTLRPEDLAHPITFTRLNCHFESAVRLARLVLEGGAITDQVGTASAGTFLVNMPKLFEAFIHARLRRHLAGVLDVVAQQQHRFAANRSDPRIQPDLEFRIGKETRYVADAKYKLTTDGLGRISDYYQLLAYATVLQVPEGVLIYCHDDGDPPPSRLIVQNTSIVLWVRAVALNGTPSDVDARLRNLAVWIAGRQSRPAR